MFAITLKISLSMYCDYDVTIVVQLLCIMSKQKLRPQKSVWFLLRPKKDIGRIGRDFFSSFFFLLFSFFNSHDSLQLDGFNGSLPCCNCIYMQKN